MELKRTIQKAAGTSTTLIVISSVFVIIIAGCTDIRRETVYYESGNSRMKGFIAYDSSVTGKRPGILVVHEWWGLNGYARMRAEMLARLGYTALAVDMYGDGKQTAHPDEAEAFAKDVMQNIEAGRERFIAAMDLLKKHPTVNPQKIAAIGYCFGGGIVLQMARSGVDLDGVVSFHGGLITTEPAKPGAVKAKILVCHGEEDDLVTSEQMATFIDEMKRAGADIEIITYESAKHSFTNSRADTYAEKFGLPLGYNAGADEKSWEDMKEFLEDIF